MDRSSVFFLIGGATTALTFRVVNEGIESLEHGIHQYLKTSNNERCSLCTSRVHFILDTCQEVCSGTFALAAGVGVTSFLLHRFH